MNSWEKTEMPVGVEAELHAYGMCSLKAQSLGVQIGNRVKACSSRDENLHEPRMTVLMRSNH